MPDANYTLKATPTVLCKLLVPSLLGILVFFVPLPIGGKTAVRSMLGGTAAYYAMAVIVAGALYPVITVQWAMRLAISSPSPPAFWVWRLFYG